jgi:hypothetical protein
MPVAAFLKCAFAKAEEILDRLVISNVLVDEPIREGRLAARGRGIWWKAMSTFRKQLAGDFLL